MRHMVVHFVILHQSLKLTSSEVKVNFETSIRRSRSNLNEYGLIGIGEGWPPLSLMEWSISSFPDRHWSWSGVIQILIYQLFGSFLSISFDLSKSWPRQSQWVCYSDHVAPSWITSQKLPTNNTNIRAFTTNSPNHLLNTKFSIFI